MDTLMIIVTASSLEMAVCMGAIVVKLVREEVSRSHARVAALVAMSDDSDIEVAPATPVAPVIRSESRLAATTPRRSAAVYDADLELRPSATSALPQPYASPAILFTTSVEP